MEELAPARSRTDPPAPEAQRSQRQHLRRRLHANTIGQIAGTNQHRQHRQIAKDAVTSAIESTPINFDNLLRREKKGPEAHANTKEVAKGQLDGSPASQNWEVPKRQARPEDVAKAKRDNVKREEQLRASLKNVEEIGMSSTRQLDDTYYAILEKASILRSTVASLQQLADDSKRMHTSFEEETSKLERETAQNVQSFADFDQQETTINELVSRLQDSRAKTNLLNERLESARLRVEAYEKRDNEKQANRRAKWHMTCLSLFGLAVVFIAILVLKNRRRVGDAVEQQLLWIGDLVEDVAAPRHAKPSPTEDPYLQRLFDEL